MISPAAYHSSVFFHDFSNIGLIFPMRYALTLVFYLIDHYASPMIEKPLTVLCYTYLGMCSYQTAWDKQESIRQSMIEKPRPGELWLLEHPPTLSLGKTEMGANLLASHKQLKNQGFDIVQTNRGGKVTYHGPGQLVVYPIVDLRMLKKTVKQYVHGLEETMLLFLTMFGLQGRRENGHPGIWVGTRKIGSLGIHVKRHVAIHGLAINIATNLSHFDVINPCGQAGLSMTSLLQEGTKTAVSEVIPTFTKAFSTTFRCELSPK